MNDYVERFRISCWFRSIWKKLSHIIITTSNHSDFIYFDIILYTFAVAVAIAGGGPADG